MSVAIELFIIGITVSFGPCLAICSPIVLPYIAATKRGWRDGLWTMLVFSLTRLVVYSVLGLLAGLFGGLLAAQLHRYSNIIFLVGGIFISLLGILIVLGKEPQSHFCRNLHKHSDKGIKGAVLLGLFAGIVPCASLLGVLAYIALQAADLWQGAFYGFAFGTGKLISPLIPLGILVSVLPQGLIKNNSIYNFFSRLCGVILILIGVNFVFKIL